jgi:hypothetical protein
MEQNNILTSTVIAVIISSLITWLGNRWIKKLEFRQVYYKTIIDKRIKSYQKIEKVISYFIYYNEIPTNDVSIKVLDLLSCGCKEYQKRFKKINSLLVSSMWLSFEMSLLLQDLNVVLTSLYQESKTISDEKLVKLGLKLKEQLEVLISRINIKIFEDLKDMDNIQSFLKSKIKNYKNEIKVIKE